MGLLAKFEALNDVGLTRLNDRVATLRQQIAEALALQAKQAQQTMTPGAKATAATTQGSSTSPDDLIDALATAQKRMK